MRYLIGRKTDFDSINLKASTVALRCVGRRILLGHYVQFTRGEHSVGGRGIPLSRLRIGRGSTHIVELAVIGGKLF